ncbi:histidine phosphatase family protein [uncultured Alsobacter sp.]|uniref:histidine phosphatase family protein n=1 Tax=uncultured Alsobacter sp. TaxID=1748258 RepID=UPI0025E72DF2|nr:histidine phosphatase family protein [uncultured Alsobacter sp.]
MTARLRLLCHAATAATRTVSFADDAPVDAAEHGRIARLTRLRAGTVLASPARAARDTAEVLGGPFDEDGRLADLDVGRWRGQTLDLVLAREPDAVALWMRDPTSAPHGGEPITALVARVAAFLADAADHPRLLAVTHASVLRAAVVHVLGAPAQAFWSVDAAPLGLVELSHDGRRWALRYGPRDPG